VPFSIAPEASRNDILCCVFTAILACHKMLCCAFELHSLAEADFMSLSKCRAVTFPHRKITVETTAGLCDESGFSILDQCRRHGGSFLNSK